MSCASTASLITVAWIFSSDKPSEVVSLRHGPFFAEGAHARRGVGPQLGPCWCEAKQVGIGVRVQAGV